MADPQFNPLGTANAPAQWVLPKSLSLTPKVVYASFDGTSAASAFVPCLDIIDDAGRTVGSFPCATSVAAGASADVTWFRRGVASVGSSGGKTTQPWAYITSNGVATNCAGNATTSLAADATTFYTNSSATFGTGTNSGVTGIVIKAVGHYLITNTAQTFGAAAAGSQYEVQNAGGDLDASFFGGKPVAHVVAGAIADECLVNVENVMTVRNGQTPTAAVITQIVNSTAGALSMLFDGMTIVQLDTDGTQLN